MNVSSVEISDQAPIMKKKKTESPDEVSAAVENYQSELDAPIWSVVTFEKVAAKGLTYSQAVEKTRKIKVGKSFRFVHYHGRSFRTIKSRKKEKMNSAIIVAAGSGTRFGSEIPKQFLEIAGKPLIFHTLERFENCAAIDEIILVLAENEIENFRELSQNYNLKKLNKIIAGGKTRAESVSNGLNAVDENCEIVAVHDGARPLVSSEEISATIEKASETGAACLTAKVTDTIKKIENDKIVETIDRDNLRRALTPQCFKTEILREAFANADLNESATDECFLVENIGYKIAFVDGSAKNIKITTREDFLIAEIFLKADW